MRLIQMFPKRYATGEDLQGKAVTVTISQIKREKMHPQPNAPEVEKWVLYFKETKKGIVLSKTLAYQIADLLSSDETDQWIGKTITLYPQPTTVAGRKLTVIRARLAEEAADSKRNSLPISLAEESEYEELDD